MSDQIPTPDEAMLAAIAERDFALACRVHDAAMAAEPDALPELTRAYQRVTRSLRQTLALKARLSGLAAERAQKTAERAQRQRSAEIDRRKSQIRAPLERAVWDEYESEREAESALVHLADLVDEAALADDFLDHPAEIVIARLWPLLDLNGAPRPSGIVLPFTGDSS